MIEKIKERRDEIRSMHPSIHLITHPFIHPSRQCNVMSYIGRKKEERDHNHNQEEARKGKDRKKLKGKN